MRRRLLAVSLALAVFAGNSGSVFAVDNLEDYVQEEVSPDAEDRDIEVLEDSGSPEAGETASEEYSEEASEEETSEEEAAVEGDSEENSSQEEKSEDEQEAGVLDLTNPDKSSLPLDEMWDSFQNAKEGQDYVAGEVICLSGSYSEAEKVASFYGGTLKEFNYGVATISLENSPLTVEEAFSRALDTGLNYPLVEPNYIIPIEDIEAEVISEATYGTFKASPWSSQYYEKGHDDPALNPESDNFQWYHDVIGTYGAWGVTLGRPEITVAVIDSGVNYNHEELSKSIVDVSSEIDFNKNHNMDQVGHGTHVAGIIGGIVDNNRGGAGVAPGVSIMPICVNGSNSSPSVDYIIAAIQYVAGVTMAEDGTVIPGDRRADIVNMSLSTSNYIASFKQAVDNAYEAGVTLVASMGNNSANFVVYPAYFDHVIAVEATDQSGDVSHFSSIGDWSDIMAPGVDIYSSYWTRSRSGSNDTYASMSGTSMAAPIVAGACALYMSAKGHVDPDTMERVLKESAQKGVVNVSKMLDTDDTPPSISLYANDSKATGFNTLIGNVSEGKSYTITYKIAPDSILTFGTHNFSPETSDTTNNRVVYTTDGKNPSVVGGEIKYGTVYDGKGITVSDFCGIMTGLTKVTVKALSISGMGVVSKISTLVFTVDPDMKEGSVDPALETDVSIRIVNAPMQMVAGKTIALKAVVSPSSSNIKTMWKIISYRDGDLSKAKITSSGKLSTKAGQHGILTIGCYSTDGRVYDSVDIEVVSSIKPVKSLMIPSSLLLELDPIQQDGGLPEATIEISKLTDTSNKNILDLDQVSFEWTSSNPAVVSVITDSKSATYAIVKGHKAGTARITCKALDGSNKKAICNVKVTSEKIVKSVQVVPSEESDKSDIVLNSNGTIKSISLYGNVSLSVSSVQKDSEGILKEVADPVWTVSNAKVLDITPNGKSATIKGLSKGSATVTCTARDGSGKKFSFKVNVKKLIESLTIEGQSYISPGASATYKVKILPANADNRKLSFSVTNPDDGSKIAGVSISSSGKVTVAKTVKTGTRLLITATAKDKGKVAASFTAEVLTKTSSITISPEKKTVDLFLGITDKAKESCKSSIQLTAKSNNYTDLTFTSSNPKVATLSDYIFDPKTGTNVVTVNAHAKGTTNITAKAVDGSGKQASVRIVVNQLVTGITITGQDYVVIGGSATYKAECENKDANNRNITWSLSEKDSDVVVNEKTGQLTAGKSAKAGEYHLLAAATDNSGIVAEKIITVTDRKATGVTIITDDQFFNRSVYKVKTKEDTGKIISMQLFDVDIDGYPVDDERDFQLYARVTGTEAASVKWSSSNTKVAEVTETGLVRAVSRGSTVITAEAKDGSKKKDSFKLSVITPASEIELTTADKILDTIGYGCKARVKATLEETYGQPSVKAIDWDYEIVALTISGYETFDKDLSNELKQKKAFFTFSKGVVTANAKEDFRKFEESYRQYLKEKGGTGFGVVVFAKTTDGTGYCAEKSFLAIDPVTTMEMYTYPPAQGQSVKISSDIIGLTAYSKMGTRAYMGAEKCYYRYTIKCDGKYAFTVSSSNPEIASAYCNTSNSSIFYIYPNKQGKVNIKITAKDGSGKSMTIKFTVVE
jgi:subtilisin family serine protease/uncharacterized protein YjdB